MKQRPGWNQLSRLDRAAHAHWNRLDRPTKRAFQRLKEKGIDPRLLPTIAYLEWLNPGAKQALDTLTEKGVDARLLANVLAAILAVLTLEGDKLRVWNRLPLSRHTLKTFPSRLRAMAEEIQAANDSVFLDSRIWMSFRPRDFWKGLAVRLDRGEAIRTRMAADFQKLPGMLTWYAAYMEAQTGRFARFGKTKPNATKMLEIKLLVFIHDTTGNYYYERVATLLTAVYRAAGKEKEVSPDDLKMLYHRNPYLR